MSLKDHSVKLQLAVEQASRDIRKAGYVPLFKRATGSAHYGKEKPGDYDVLVLVRSQEAPTDPTLVDADNDGMPHFAPDNLEDFIAQMVKQGYADCADLEGNTSGGDSDEDDYRSTWCALRGDFGASTEDGDTVNIIATSDIVWFYRMVAAGELCRSIAQHNGICPDKETVAGLFRCIREGVNPWVKE